MLGAHRPLRRGRAPVDLHVAARAERIGAHAGTPSGRLGRRGAGARIGHNVDRGVHPHDLRDDGAGELRAEPPCRSLAVPCTEHEGGRGVLEERGGVTASRGGESLSGGAREERLAAEQAVAQDRVADPVRGVHRRGAREGLEPGSAPVDARVRDGGFRTLVRERNERGLEPARLGLNGVAHHAPHFVAVDPSALEDVLRRTALALAGAGGRGERRAGGRRRAEAAGGGGRRRRGRQRDRGSRGSCGMSSRLEARPGKGAGVGRAAEARARDAAGSPFKRSPSPALRR